MEPLGVAAKRDPGKGPHGPGPWIGVEPLASDPIADLERRLAREATDRTRAFWTRYLRGTGRLRGGPMADLRTCVRDWWADHGFADHPAAVGKRVALALIERPTTELKLAGVVALDEMLGAQVRAGDLAVFARLFARGHLADWTVVDWFSVKVLAALIDREPGRGECARSLAQWRTADTTWQRRAACVAFTRLAPTGDSVLPGLVDLVIAVCKTVVWSHERFDQTAVGWVLRELSRAEPQLVDAFFRKHALLMSKECARCAVAHYPAAQRAELLAHHRRATSLARV